MWLILCPAHTPKKKKKKKKNQQQHEQTRTHTYTTRTHAHTRTYAHAHTHAHVHTSTCLKSPWEQTRLVIICCTVDTLSPGVAESATTRSSCVCEYRLCQQSQEQAQNNDMVGTGPTQCWLHWSVFQPPHPSPSSWSAAPTHIDNFAVRVVPQRTVCLIQYKADNGLCRACAPAQIILQRLWGDKEGTLGAPQPLACVGVL